MTKETMSSSVALSSVIDQIVELGREHRVAIREKTTLVNMLKARVREYVGFEALKADKGEAIDKRKAQAAYKALLVDRVDPLFLNRVTRILDPYDAAQRDQESLAKRMGDLAKQLPVWPWVEAQPGCGAPMLAKIVAEAGRDLSDYTTPSKLNMRFGLAVVNGKAARRERGVKLGFSSYRRSVIFQLGEGLIKHGGSEEKGNRSYWRKRYDYRKQLEIDRAVAAGLKVIPAAKITAKNKQTSMSEGHVHNRAKRYMEKGFLIALWEEWTSNRRVENRPEFFAPASNYDSQIGLPA